MEQPSWIKHTFSDRYTIEALLGQGGMSAVYKANDPNLKRVVAIKLIHPHLATDSKFIARFEEEATAVAKLRHPNIVQVFDFNSDEGVYYMVLEFIPGETLQERLRRLNKAGRQLSLEEAIKFTVNICDALGYAHKQGIIHRDIKPANIMLDVHGQAILMDFGIVKIIGGDSHTAAGAVVGTARYMPPEIIRSETPDQRSDIYSLGITLYEMLNGEPPFNADSAMSLMMMHLNDPVPDLHSIKPNVPPGLTNILQKSLEKNPDRRYNSADEMAADLNRVLAALERQKAAFEPTTPEAKAPKTHQAETQIDEPASKETPEEGVASQIADYATIVEPQKVDDVVTKEDIDVFVKARDIPAPFQSAQGPAYKSATPQTPDKPAKNIPWLPLLLGLGASGVIVIVVLIAGIFVLGKIFKVDTASLVLDTPDRGQQVPATQPDLVAATEPPTLTPTLDSAPTDVLAATNTLPPLYAQITAITTNMSYQYVVEYETFGFIETLPGMHVHFFFDTVAPEEAGPPGKGPWKMYGGPSPFTGYSEVDRPANATRMCVLVVNANHSVILGSGNCYDLP
jgi:serine/threonine protein kinase